MVTGFTGKTCIKREKMTFYVIVYHLPRQKKDWSFRVMRGWCVFYVFNSLVYSVTSRDLRNQNGIRLPILQKYPNKKRVCVFDILRPDELGTLDEPRP